MIINILNQRMTPIGLLKASKHPAKVKGSYIYAKKC
jgi:hypothetical protein